MILLNPTLLPKSKRNQQEEGITVLFYHQYRSQKSASFMFCLETEAFYLSLGKYNNFVTIPFILPRKTFLLSSKVTSKKKWENSRRGWNKIISSSGKSRPKIRINCFQVIFLISKINTTIKFYKISDSLYLKYFGFFSEKKRFPKNRDLKNFLGKLEKL